MKEILNEWRNFINENEEDHEVVSSSEDSQGKKEQPMYIGYEPDLPGILMAQVLEDDEWDDIVNKSIDIASKVFRGQQKPEPNNKNHLIDRFVKLDDDSIHKVRTISKEGEIELYGKELGRHPKISPVEVVAYSVQNVFLTSPSYEEAMENKKSLGDLASQNNKEPEPEENENEKDVE